ncbi:MAG: four helix bundle protein [Bacteroidales bacterium]
MAGLFLEIKFIMAIYYNLPVYKKTYDLILELFNLSSNLPKAYKYTLGERIQLDAIEVIINIYKANASIEKLEYISKSREHIEIIRLMIRILYDTKQINLKRMIVINKKIEEISKQLVGWQKYCTNK